MKSCTKVKECPKTVLKEFTLKLWDTLGYSGFWSKNKNSIFTIWWTLNHYDLETNMLSPRCYGNASTRKRLNAEMPQKPVLRNFRSFWEIPQNWKGISEYFWGVFYKYFRFFWGVSVFFEAFPFFEKNLKLYFVEAFPPFLRRFRFFWGVSAFWKKFLNFILLRRFLFFWGVSVFFWGVSVFLKNF